MVSRRPTPGQREHETLGASVNSIQPLRRDRNRGNVDDKSAASRKSESNEPSVTEGQAQERLRSAQEETCLTLPESHCCGLCYPRKVTIHRHSPLLVLQYSSILFLIGTGQSRSSVQRHAAEELGAFKTRVEQTPRRRYVDTARIQPNSATDLEHRC
jgi:hypothetical protein